MIINKTANNKKEVETQRYMSDIEFMMMELDAMSKSNNMTRYKSLIRASIDSLDELFDKLDGDNANIILP